MANSLIGAGGCIRDKTSSWVIGFSKFTGFGNPLHSELWAIWLGLDITTHMFPNSKLQIETDSYQVMELLLYNYSDTHPLYSLIKNYNLLLSSFSESKITHICRLQNRCVDTLAKEGRINILTLTIYNEVPDSIRLTYTEEKSLCNLPSLG